MKREDANDGNEQKKPPMIRISKLKQQNMTVMHEDLNKEEIQDEAVQKLKHLRLK